MTIEFEKPFQWIDKKNTSNKLWYMDANGILLGYIDVNSYVDYDSYNASGEQFRLHSVYLEYSKTNPVIRVTSIEKAKEILERCIEIFLESIETK